jgi:hypothetical protein
MNPIHLRRVLADTIHRVFQSVDDTVDSEDDHRYPYNALAGGVLNYRTEELDDGTDPTGWYEDD